MPTKFCHDPPRYDEGICKKALAMGQNNPAPTTFLQVSETCHLRMAPNLAVLFMTTLCTCLPRFAMNRQGLMKASATTHSPSRKKNPSRTTFVQVSETCHLQIAPNFVGVLTTTRQRCLPSFATNRQGLMKASAEMHSPWRKKKVIGAEENTKTKNGAAPKSCCSRLLIGSA